MNNSKEIDYFIFSTSVEEFSRLKAEQLQAKLKELSVSSKISEPQQEYSVRQVKARVLHIVESGNGLTNREIKEISDGLEMGQVTDATYMLAKLGQIRADGEGRGKKYYPLKK